MSTTSYSPPETVHPVIRTSSAGVFAKAFSFPVMCVFLLAAAILWFCARAIVEPDIWWHLRNAAFLFQNHAFPSIDTYSWGAAGSPWLDHEWLSEIPLFLGFRAMGLPGLLAVYFATLVAIYSAVYYRCFRAGADCLSASIATLVAIFLGIVSIGPRPLLFGWLCLMGLMLVLDGFQREEGRLWLLPPLFMLWVNLHGSWVFGIVAFALVLASGSVEGEWGLVSARRWTPSQLKQLMLSFAASIAALFVNPFGYKLVLYPFDLLFRQPANLKYIEEWHAVDFSRGSGKLMMLVIFGWLAAALLSRAKWRLDQVLLLAFALWAGLSHARLLFFTGLMAAPIFAPRLELFAPYEPEKDKPWLNAGVMAVVLTWLCFAFPSATALQGQLDRQFPTAAIQFLEQHHINGRIFNSDFFGGYMEWMAPELKPFIDSRTDIFVYNQTFDDFVKAATIQSPLEVLDKYKVDYVFIESRLPLAYVLKHSGAWQPIYSDNVAVVLERAAASKAVP